MNSVRIVQLAHTNGQRRVAIVKEPNLALIRNFDSVYSLAREALERKVSLRFLLSEISIDESILYDEVYEGKSVWRLLPALDHSQDPRFCQVSGTGLTHKASAQNRNQMHNAAASQLTDSMKIYQWGERDGKPGMGNIGVQPEWFYKGNGSILRAHMEDLSVPNYGNDGGEEPELAALYINDRNGDPCRIGFATANEFSDHVMEKKNYLYLAPSKIRTCSIGPELVLTDHINELRGRVIVTRGSQGLWEKEIRTGESNMAYSLENLEYHHFKYANHRLPFDVHVYFLGADSFSFGENLTLADGDEMIVSWENMGRPLRNTLRIDLTPEFLKPVRQLG